MKKLMRKPRIENKYNLTMSNCRNLELINREKMERKFWRNNVINAYCLSGNTAKNNKDHEYGTYSEYWIGVYDKDDKIKIDFSSYGGMCGYKFKEFYNPKDIKIMMIMMMKSMRLIKNYNLI